MFGPSHGWLHKTGLTVFVILQYLCQHNVVKVHIGTDGDDGRGHGWLSNVYNSMLHAIIKACPGLFKSITKINLENLKQEQIIEV